jgi:hypothetical protein
VAMPHIPRFIRKGRLAQQQYKGDRGDTGDHFQSANKQLRAVFPSLTESSPFRNASSGEFWVLY